MGARRSTWPFPPYCGELVGAHTNFCVSFVLHIHGSVRGQPSQRGTFFNILFWHLSSDAKISFVTLHLGTCFMMSDSTNQLCL